jgi:transglutaminase-like putative cysteine protease/tetratricopeptide (TPR) repeat protein
MLICPVLFCAGLRADDVWNSPAFSVAPEALRQAADTVKPAKDYDATVLLNEYHFSFDSTGRVTEVRHRIYRVDRQEGVQGWSETSSLWSPWHQAKPELKARVITSDGAEHALDAKTLHDLPVHEDAPDVYSDERRFGGPLPAIALGVIVEEEITLRDTAPFFAAGTTTSRSFAWYAPVAKTRVVLSYPESAPVRYKLRCLPDVSANKSSANGVETVTLEQGPLPAFSETPPSVPPDAALYPAITFTTGTTWQKLAAEYARLTDEKLRLADVQLLMAKINVKEGTREQIIRRAVTLLHSNVRYTGVEFDEANLIPQFPAETLKRKYGDCKDKATLLVAMLRSAGINANLALLDTGPGLDIDPDLPGMGGFDHAIVYIPANGSDPALWVDATAQYTQVGSLPWGDYGRRALIVSTTTDSLAMTPELTSAQVVHSEKREFTMAEYGPAQIVEINEDIGPGDADARDYYSGDPKKLKKDADNYVKDMYLAESLTAMEHGDLTNLEKPAAVKYVTTGRRGMTYFDSATMAIRTEGMFNSLPRYFRTAEVKPAAGSDPDDGEKPRTVDWWIHPFTTEWEYTIKAPLGFKVRALPGDVNEKIGTLVFTRNYTSQADGSVVEARLRLENTQRRLTVGEGKQLRDAVVKALNRDAILITFDHVGHSLIAGGQVKEGLAAYEQVAAQHPKEAVHKARLALALLTAGLGESARKVATEATKLEPNSFVAETTLAEALKNDLVGRPLKKGMDYAGAVAAYRQAIVLDPKDKEARVNLALLLEYDASGIRYADPAALREAVVVLRDLKKLDEGYEREYEDNVLYDLWYGGDYKGLLEYAATLPTSDTRKGLTVAATAVETGIDPALKKSLEATTDEQSRGKVLANASAVLIRARKYPEAAAMIAEASKGQSDEGQNRSLAVLSKTKLYTEVKIDSADPRSVVYRLFQKMLSGTLKLEELKSLVYIDPDNTTATLDQKEFEKMMSTMKQQIGSGGLPLAVIADIAISNMRCTLEGDENSGYKVTLEAPGAAAQTIFVMHDGGAYKIASFSSGTETTNAEDLAWLVLRELKKNNLTAARTWLDRARELIHASSGDDPLSGALFPQFWTKGQDADAATMRTAALSLMESKAAGSYLSELNHARAAAKTDAERTRLTLVIAYADSATKRWNDLLSASQDLLKAAPSSVRAFNFATTAYRQLKLYDEWDKLVQEKMKQYPDELDYTRSSAALELDRGNIEKSRAILKGIIDKGKATESDLNQYAWYALMLPQPITDETIEVANRANDLSKNNFSIIHTVACIYAQAGKTSQAREYLLKAMEAGQLEEPDSAVWFGFGLIAEQYGAFDAAESMYRRVEKPEFESVSSNYAIAQKRLELLSSAKAPSKQ